MIIDIFMADPEMINNVYRIPFQILKTLPRSGGCREWTSLGTMGWETLATKVHGPYTVGCYRYLASATCRQKGRGIHIYRHLRPLQSYIFLATDMAPGAIPILMSSSFRNFKGNKNPSASGDITQPTAYGTAKSQRFHRPWVQRMQVRLLEFSLYFILVVATPAKNIGNNNPKYG